MVVLPVTSVTNKLPEPELPLIIKLLFVGVVSLIAPVLESPVKEYTY